MATEVQSPPATFQYSADMTEAELLHQFLTKRLRRGERNETIDHLLDQFAEYRRELEALREKVREAVASLDRGEGGPLDLEALFARVDARLEKEGIPE